MRDAAFSADRRDIHDPAFFASPHLGEHCQRAVERTPDMYLERLPVILRRHGIHRTHADGSGVVDQNIDGPQLTPYPINSTVYLIALRDVTFHRHYTVTPAVQIGGGTLQLAGITGQQSDSRSSPQELPRHDQAQAPRPAGDHDRFTA